MKENFNINYNIPLLSTNREMLLVNWVQQITHTTTVQTPKIQILDLVYFETDFVASADELVHSMGYISIYDV